jgi:hypothetical protein
VDTREYAPKKEIAASFEAVGSPCPSRDLELKTSSSNVKSEKIKVRLRTGHISISVP